MPQVAKLLALLVDGDQPFLFHGKPVEVHASWAFRVRGWYRNGPTPSMACCAPGKSEGRKTALISGFGGDESLDSLDMRGGEQ